MRSMMRPAKFQGRPAGPSVKTFSRPYAPFHDRYQKYYRTGLRQYCVAIGGDFEVVHLARLPHVLAALRTARDRGYYEGLGIPAVGAFIDRVAGRLDKPITT